MGSSLATIRARLQIVLDDAGAAYWSAAELDSHIAAALKDLSHHHPRERTATLSTSPNVRDISASSVTDLIRVRALEHPIGEDPRRMRSVEKFGTTLRVLDDPKPDGTDAILYYDAYHVINGTSSLDTAHDETLVLGAAWLACLQQQADTSNNVNDGGATAPRDWAALATEFARQYRTRLATRHALRTSRMHSPGDFERSNLTSDPGP